MLYDGTPGQNANTSLTKPLTGFSRIRVNVLKRSGGSCGCGSIEVSDPDFETWHYGMYVAPNTPPMEATFGVSFLTATSFRVNSSLSNVMIIGFK